MNHLLRSLAPISEAGWELLDQEAKERLTPALHARKLLDFDGPHGWQHSATNLGRTTALGTGPADGTTARQRRVLPLIELRADFTLSREELRDGDRGADDVDLAPLDAAAHQIAKAESAAIFHGWGEAVAGIIAASPHAEPEPGADYSTRVAAAVELLLESGIGGPYALALGATAYRAVEGAAEHGGYPLSEHVKEILGGGPIIWTPGLSGGVVLSQRGGDFVFDSGQDLASRLRLP